MTREEAISNLKMILDEATETDEAICYVTSNDAETINMAIKALKKQTTKYKHIGTRLTYWGKYKYIFKCENCGLTKEFTDNHTAQYKFCPSCGREIDWSKPKGNDCDFMFIDEVIAYDTQKKD